MLSRMADSLYWLSRYTERAENLARILDVAQRLGIPAHPGDLFHTLFLYSLAQNGVRIVRRFE